jgi:hypothetical protein
MSEHNDILIHETIHLISFYPLKMHLSTYLNIKTTMKCHSRCGFIYDKATALCTAQHFKSGSSSESSTSHRTAQVWSHTNPHWICDGQSGSLKGFLHVIWFYPITFLSPVFHIHIHSSTTLIQGEHISMMQKANTAHFELTPKSCHSEFSEVYTHHTQVSHVFCKAQSWCWDNKSSSFQTLCSAPLVI